MTKNLTIPIDPQAITPTWLNEALQSSRVGHHSPVTACQIEDMSDNPGYTGQLVRLKLDYADPAEALPASLIAKLVHPDPKMYSRAAVAYEREVRFYQHLAPQAHLPTPHCYYADIDLDTGASILLLEDLAQLRSVDMTTGCTLAEAEVVIQHLAHFHAQWWNSPQLQGMDYLGPYNDRIESRQPAFQMQWTQFPQNLERIIPEINLSPAFLDLGQRFNHHMVRLFTELAQRPITLLHRDTHVNNLLFGPVGGDRPLVVFDWQAYCYGRGGSDVSRFMVTSLPITLRRQAEGRLLQTYHQLLTAQGVIDYDFRTCWADYQKGFFGSLFPLVFLVNNFDVDRPHGRAMLQTRLPRMIAFSEDHDLGQFL